MLISFRCVDSVFTVLIVCAFNLVVGVLWCCLLVDCRLIGAGLFDLFRFGCCVFVAFVTW